MTRRKKWFKFVLVLILGGLAVVAAVPGGPDLKLGKINKKLEIQRGLDLQGGSHLVYEADLSKIKEEDKVKAMQSLQTNIEKRVNSFGVSEPNVYTSKLGDSRRLVIEMPGVKDVDKAMDLIGKTAQLKFKEIDETGQGFADTPLTGQHLANASMEYDQQTNKPQIALVFNDEGKKLFGEITKKNLGKQLAIFLDDEMLTAPTVQSEITEGKAVITGEYKPEDAKKMAIQLNAGALPVSIKNVEQRTVGATLGKDSINKSLIAGALAIVIVSIFMLIYYRILGLFSTLGLGLYLALMITLFKLFSITVTMGGIAGFILSIGMSMETDVLIFERIREELRNGRTFSLASHLGFQKAWPSIKDSNLVSFIICIILYNAGGLVRGFAVVLGLGIAMGLLTTFLGTRTLIDIISGMKFVKQSKYFRA
ncbi:protein translocase subunit SecD [bacterium (Candidatus Howlettbacteria) CG_4_10_14_0_8_um_filter_40_9]|nr:MAG: protein translocase subunit SecD [bacterium (Candidatus Howlettbacteria) CG_4_10_14_0_8_um_filter_40_9]